MSFRTLEVWGGGSGLTSPGLWVGEGAELPRQQTSSIPTRARRPGLHVLPKYLFYAASEGEFLEFPECVRKC